MSHIRFAITIGGVEEGPGIKTMILAKDYNPTTRKSDCHVTLLIPHGTVVALPRAIAGVEKTDDGYEIWHGVDNILDTWCLGAHYNKLDGDYGKPSVIAGRNWEGGKTEEVEDAGVNMEVGDAATNDAATTASTNARTKFEMNKERVLVEKSDEGWEEFLLYLFENGLIIEEYE